jgi:hypothetical protein
MKNRNSKSRSFKISLRTSIFSVFAVVSLLKLFLIFRANFNWDEFLYLTRVFEVKNGTLSRAFQTFYVRFFFWLPQIGTYEFHHLQAARTVSFLCHLGSAALLFSWIRKLFDEKTAIWSLLFFALFSSNLIHALSFRADPYCVFLCLAALRLSVNRSKSYLLATATLIALALLISVKSLGFLPAIAFSIFKQSGSQKQRRLVIFGVTMAGVYGALTLIHKAFLNSAFVGSPIVLPATPEVKMAAGAFKKVFLSEGFFPNFRYTRNNIFENLALYSLYILGIYRALRTRKNAQYLNLLMISMPLFSVALYRNSYPYYFIFFAPGLALVAALEIQKFKRKSWILLVLLLQFLLETGVQLSDTQKRQRDVIATVHNVFPSPVPYFDRCGTISSFPMANFFMSTWVMSTYKVDKVDFFTRSFQANHPQFLLATHECLNPALLKGSRCPVLSPNDRKTIVENYTHYWGPIYLLGSLKRAPPESAPPPRSFFIGFKTYTLRMKLKALGIPGL